MNITIRKAAVEDIEALSVMLKKLFSIEDDFIIDESKQKVGLNMIITGSSGIILIAEYESKPAGMVNLQKIVSTAAGGYSVLLEDLFIVPELRGKGIGSLLIEEAEKWGKNEQAVRIQLAADVRNISAIAFYSAVGFKMSNMSFHYKKI